MLNINTIYDVVIVGSGPSAVAAAYQFSLSGIIPVIVDVGFNKNKKIQNENLNFYHYAEKFNTKIILFDNEKELVSQIINKSDIPSKLKSPAFKYIIEKNKNAAPIVQKTSFLRSFAMGGMANGWGAGLYEFDDFDLKNFPIKKNELIDFYNILGRKIGISGELDDLLDYFGDSSYLLPPIIKSSKVKIILNRYAKINKNSPVKVGNPRLGILSEDFNGRKKHQNLSWEFWDNNLNSIFTPNILLEELMQQKKVDYFPGFYVEKYNKHSDFYELELLPTNSSEKVKIKASNIFLAAGCIETTKIVLNSAKKENVELPLRDNDCLQFPLVMPEYFGKKLDIESFGLTQLNFILTKNNQRYQGSLLEITSPRRAEFLTSLPFDYSTNLFFIQNLLPSMLVFQLFLPEVSELKTTISVLDGKIQLKSTNSNIEDNEIIIDEYINFFRKLGVFTFKKLIQKPSRGSGLHYGGTLPMKDVPTGMFECDKYCKLNFEKSVYILDGSCFPELPSKNYSFTLMANSMRAVNHFINNRISHAKS